MVKGNIYSIVYESVKRNSGIDLVSKSRKEDSIVARSVYYYVCKSLGGKYKNMAEYIGYNHATALHLRNNVVSLLEDEAYKSRFKDKVLALLEKVLIDIDKNNKELFKLEVKESDFISNNFVYDNNLYIYETKDFKIVCKNDFKKYKSYIVVNNNVIQLKDINSKGDLISLINTFDLKTKQNLKNVKENIISVC
jgi:hypothetical protein